MTADYRVRFECDGHIITPRPVPMIYVAHPGPDSYIVLGRRHGDPGRYRIAGITWTPGREWPCDYVLSVEWVGDAPAWALQCWGEAK